MRATTRETRQVNNSGGSLVDIRHSIAQLTVIIVAPGVDLAIGVDSKAVQSTNSDLSDPVA